MIYIKCYLLHFRGQSEQSLSQVSGEQKSDETTKDEVFVKEYKCSYSQDDSLQDTKPAEMSLSVLDRMASGNWREVWNPRMSMSLTSTKGLLNPAGQNNCFLNSAVQVSGVSISMTLVFEFIFEKTFNRYWRCISDDTSVHILSSKTTRPKISVEKRSLFHKQQRHLCYYSINLRNSVHIIYNNNFLYMPICISVYDISWVSIWYLMSVKTLGLLLQRLFHNVFVTFS